MGVLLTGSRQMRIRHARNKKDFLFSDASFLSCSLGQKQQAAEEYQADIPFGQGNPHCPVIKKAGDLRKQDGKSQEQMPDRKEAQHRPSDTGSFHLYVGKDSIQIPAGHEKENEKYHMQDQQNTACGNDNVFLDRIVEKQGKEHGTGT